MTAPTLTVGAPLVVANEVSHLFSISLKEINSHPNWYDTTAF